MRPDEPPAVPDIVRRLAGDAPLVAVWRNELGGLAFRIGDDRYVKWTRVGDLAGEAERLTWAGRFTSVPRVLGHGTDGDGSWLVTAALPGRSAVDPYWIARPAAAARALGAALRALHDALPVDGCPYDWSVATRLRRAGLTGFAEPPPVDRLVVCQGDPCAPNTLLHDDGTPAGHVDLGALGVADRWADLAVAAWSTEWNHGTGHVDAVYAGYGVGPDAERIAYYRTLWAAT